MPSTVVHVALAGLVGTALLADHFDWKAVAVVMAATAFVDLDAVLGLWVEGAHRAAFHTLLVPALGGALLWVDLGGRDHLPARVRDRIGDRSYLRSRWGTRGVRVAWVSLFAVTFAGIGPDAFFNGANLFYPVHDRFYDLSGKLLYSTQRGVVQTMVEVDPSLNFLTEWATGDASASAATPDSGGGSSKPVDTTENTHYSTPVDPTEGDAPEGKAVERLFPVAMTGERAVLALTGYLVVGLRVWEERNR